MKEYDIEIHVLIEAKSKEAAKKEFIEAFGMEIYNNCDSFEIIE